MLHWRQLMTFNLILVLLALAAIGGGFRWTNFVVAGF